MIKNAAIVYPRVAEIDIVIESILKSSGLYANNVLIWTRSILWRKIACTIQTVYGPSLEKEQQQQSTFPMPTLVRRPFYTNDMEDDALPNKKTNKKQKLNTGEVVDTSEQHKQDAYRSKSIRKKKSKAALARKSSRRKNPLKRDRSCFEDGPRVREVKGRQHQLPPHQRIVGNTRGIRCSQLNPRLLKDLPTASALSSFTEAKLKRHLDMLKSEKRRKRFNHMSNLLTRLMEHSKNVDGVFNRPVDPIEQNLPTYTSIVTVSRVLCSTVDIRSTNHSFFYISIKRTQWISERYAMN